MPICSGDERTQGTILTGATVKSSLRRVTLEVLLVGLMVPFISVMGQATSGVSMREVSPAGPTEDYLRALAVEKGATAIQWTVRPHSPWEVDLIRRMLLSGEHPWRDHLDTSRGGWFDVLPFNASVRFNSGFPEGYGDNAVWAGRGFTLVAQGGFAVRRGPVSLTLAPVLFRAANQSFRLRPVVAEVAGFPFANEFAAANIDRPQRFGESPYARLDAGQSSIRVDAFGLSAGASSGNEAWGPAHRLGYILTAEGPGFFRLFAGTSAPADLWIGKASLRLMWGQLRQSEYSPAPDSLSLRYATGGVVSFQPRGVPGLELGLSRFFHERWPRRGFSGANFALIGEGILKSTLPAADSGGLEGESRPNNQLASVFARWGAKSAEVYAEMGREDHSYDRRDLVVHPDHVGSLMVGFQRTHTSRSGILQSTHLEWVSFRKTVSERARDGGATYVHGAIPQGHTHLGQPLGVPGVTGDGSVMRLAHVRYSPRGSSSFNLRRVLRNARGRRMDTGATAEWVALTYSGSYERTLLAAGREVGLLAGLSFEPRTELSYERLNLSLSARFGLDVFR